MKKNKYRPSCLCLRYTHAVFLNYHFFVLDLYLLLNLCFLYLTTLEMFNILKNDWGDIGNKII